MVLCTAFVWTVTADGGIHAGKANSYSAAVRSIQWIEGPLIQFLGQNCSHRNRVPTTKNQFRKCGIHTELQYGMPGPSKVKDCLQRTCLKNVFPFEGSGVTVRQTRQKQKWSLNIGV